ncbi:MAG: glycosyltransferase [Firmicutes bacterium]|uniref:Glycosyltransferase n=1 Tax=Candidatus Onthovivens merdipullorum TaxID=2840889 RepID=A0A9D9DHV7_9BACL|nr:glycosyltransferase [Candidatus Onthovivens merdipullorum]
MKKVEVICPLFNGKSFVDTLVSSILKQKEIDIKRINFIITDTNDGTENHLVNIDNRINYKIIKREDYSHSLTREKAIFESDSDIVIMISQDIKINDDMCFFNLVKCFDTDENIAISYGRQISDKNNIEKYIREVNYPNYSFITTSDDIKKEQLNAFFFSDAFSAYDVNVFKKINGYDNKNLPTNEDMYYAKKILLLGYKKYYSSEAVVVHSHNYKLKELYSRYYNYGKFFKEVPEFKNYKSTQSGLSLALKVFKKAFKELNFRVLFRFIPDMFVRYVGKKRGERK